MAFYLKKVLKLLKTFLLRNEKFFADLTQLYTVYPDIYLDTIQPENSQFDLFPYQRCFLRSLMRYNQVYITATRAASKSFLSVLGMFLQCVFIPGPQMFTHCASQNTRRKNLQRKIAEILKIWPLLEKELEVFMGKPHINLSKDVGEAYFKNGSLFTVEGANLLPLPYSNIRVIKLF